MIHLADQRALRRVGIPIHETLLVEAAVKFLPRLFPPGAGRSLYVLREPEVGAGRPDVVALHVSPGGLTSHLERRPPIPHSTAAKSLHDTSDDGSFGVEKPYGRRLRRSMIESGWSAREIAAAAALVHDSLAIEVKLRDWRRAVRQAAKFSPLVARSALLLPGTAAEPTAASLDFYSLGLLQADPRARVRWVKNAPPQTLPPYARLWLLELLARGLRDGSAQRLS